MKLSGTVVSLELCPGSSVLNAFPPNQIEAGALSLSVSGDQRYRGQEGVIRFNFIMH